MPSRPTTRLRSSSSVKPGSRGRTLIAAIREARIKVVAFPRCVALIPRTLHAGNARVKKRRRARGSPAVSCTTGAQRVLTKRRDPGETEVPWWRRRESKPVDLGHEEARTVVNPLDSADGVTPTRDETERPKPDVTSAADAVEIALADALTKATAAERWDVVAQLARELEARRLARHANVVVLSPARRHDGGAR